MHLINLVDNYSMVKFIRHYNLWNKMWSIGVFWHCVLKDAASELLLNEFICLNWGHKGQLTPSVRSDQCSCDTDFIHLLSAREKKKTHRCTFELHTKILRVRTLKHMEGHTRLRVNKCDGWTLHRSIRMTDGPYQISGVCVCVCVGG